MVNIKAILCITGREGVLHFRSVSQYRLWRLAQCADTAEKEELSLYYNVIAVRGEKYLEEKFNLDRGDMFGIHHIFNTTTRAENYLKDSVLLAALTSSPFVVLETNLDKNYVALSIYLANDYVGSTVNFKESTTVVDLGANLTDVLSSHSRV